MAYSRLETSVFSLRGLPVFGDRFCPVKIKRSVFWTALALASILFAVACEQSPGTGGEVKANLSSPADLAKIGVDDDYPLDGVYTLTADLTLTDWTPIGTADEPFAGIFDGKGKTITITGSGGLFGFADGAVITNVIVEGTINFTGETGVSAAVGGIINRAENTSIVSCVSHANVTVEPHGPSSSAGGIVGDLRLHTTIANCYATGNITLRSGKGESFLFHAGGIAGYQGSGLNAEGTSGCVIERCYFTGAVTAEGNYPYVGGIVGYNYAGSIVRQSYAVEGSVTANGNKLPYAGGISGYNSRTAEDRSPSLIEDCYSGITVNAVSAAKQALAGGITAANAADAAISGCYARGPVTATVVGNGSGDTGGSIGVPASASAGGIAGAQYVHAPSIKNCVALNTKIEGKDSGSGADYNIHRIAGMGTSGEPAWEANIANAVLAADGTSVAPSPGSKGYDGDDCAAQPEQSAYTDLGWDFVKVWKMAGNGYPVLQWQEQEGN